MNTRLLHTLPLILILAWTTPSEAQRAGGLRSEGPVAQHLSGPRFGLTFFTGDVATLRRRAGLSPRMMQFGWQLEKQLVSVSGHRALIEVVLLVGGLEDGDINITRALLAGYRLPGGFELGAGPAVGMSSEHLTTSMVAVAGATVPFGDVYVPLNVAVAMAQGGPRVTALAGWIVR